MAAQCGCWELNKVPLGEQQTLLTTEPSPQPLLHLKTRANLISNRTAYNLIVFPPTHTPFQKLGSHRVAFFDLEFAM